MNRKNYYFGQLVSDTELDDGFGYCEDADHIMSVDHGWTGIASGLSVVQVGGGNLTVDVSSGVAYDQTGQRIAVVGTQNVDMSVDEDSISTAVSGGGNSKIVSLFVKFKRVLTDVRIDDNAINVYFDEAESFEFHVIQGAEAGSPTPPPLESDMILLADITRSFGDSTISTADISLIGRRQDRIVVAGSPFSVRRGQVNDAISDLLGYINGISGSTAAGISYAGGGAWAGGTSPTNPATDVEAQLDKIIGDLAATTGSASGAHRIGSATIAGSPAIASGTLYAQLQALKLAVNLEYGGGNSWAGGSSATNPAATIEAQLDKIIVDLSATTAGASGAHRLGCAAIGSNGATNLHAMLTTIDGRNVYKDSDTTYTSGTIQHLSRLQYIAGVTGGEEKRIHLLTDVNQSVDHAFDIYEIPAVSGTRTYSFDVTPAPPDGRMVLFVREGVDETNDVVFKNGAAATIWTILSGKLGFAWFYSKGGDWKIGPHVEYTP